jgi:hypothetical protein
MAAGLSTTNLANKWLDMMGGTAFTAPTTVYVKLHTSDPGASAATAASANTTRAAVTWSAAATGAKSMSGTLTWATWAAGTETISHISIWDASTAGNFLWSGALTAAKTVNNGDTLNITSLILSLTPLAA